MRRAAVCVIAGTFLAILTATEVNAAPITFLFTGVVSDVPLDEVGTGIGAGDSISGSFTFESTTVDLIPAASAGSYQGGGALVAMSVDVGGNPFATSDFLAVSVANGFPPDQYAVLACSAGGGCSGDLQIELFFQDNNGTVFGSDALPLTPPNLAAFELKAFHLIALVGGNQLQVDGSIDSLECPSCVATVPEPATWLLLATGAGALARRRRR